MVQTSTSIAAPREAGRTQFNGALILSVTMLGVSAGNYLLNVLLARFLSPAEFGDANVAVNLVLIAAALAATLQLLSARSGTTNDAAGANVRRKLMVWAWGIGAAIGIGLVFGSSLLAQTFKTSTSLLFIVIGVGLPVYLAQAVMRGALQGAFRLGRLALSYAAEALTRVGLAVGMLALGFGVVGAAVAISLSFVASAAVARQRAKGQRAGTPGTGAAQRGELAAVSVAATVLLVGQVVIANGDVILAKALMAPEAAGTYAAAAVIGRGLYFLSWSVVHSTFPLVARAGSAEERRKALMRALAMVVGTSVVGVAGLGLLGEQLAPLLFGDDYRSAAAILAPYALATGLFAVANLIATLDLAAGRWLAPCALLSGAALQTLLLVAWGATPMSMATAQVIAMAVTVAVVGIAHLTDNRSELRGQKDN